MFTPKRAVTVLGPLIVLFSAIICMGAGAIYVSATDILKAVYHALGQLGQTVPHESNTHLILFQIRLPRIVMAFVAGAALAPVGAAMQSLFRNPLADPYVLGVSSGASLGATIAIVGGMAFTLGIGLSAFAGAMASILLLYALGFGSVRFDTKTLLLTGIALHMMFMAVVSMLIAFNHREVENIVFWTMGGFNAASWKIVAYTSVPVTVGLIVLMRYTKQMNLLSLGSATAHTLGVEVKRTSAVLMMVAALMVAFVVSNSGVIGFVGLVVPHVGRLLLGPDNRKLIPFCIWAGGGFVMVCDTLARTIAIPIELPVGCITAIIGAPYFMFMLLNRRSIQNYTHT